MKYTSDLFLEGANSYDSHLLICWGIWKWMSRAPDVGLVTWEFSLCCYFLPVPEAHGVQILFFFFNISCQSFHFACGEIKEAQGTKFPKEDSLLLIENCIPSQVFPQIQICGFGLGINLESKKVLWFHRDIKGPSISQRRSTTTNSLASQILFYAMNWPKIRLLVSELLVNIWVLFYSVSQVCMTLRVFPVILQIYSSAL